MNDTAHYAGFVKAAAECGLTLPQINQLYKRAGAENVGRLAKILKSMGNGIGKHPFMAAGVGLGGAAGAAAGAAAGGRYLGGLGMPAAPEVVPPAARGVTPQGGIPEWAKMLGIGAGVGGLGLGAGALLANKDKEKENTAQGGVPMPQIA